MRKFSGLAPTVVLTVAVSLLISSCRVPKPQVPSEEARPTVVRTGEIHPGTAPPTVAPAAPPGTTPAAPATPTYQPPPGARPLTLEEQRLMELREKQLTEGSPSQFSAESAYRVALGFYQQLEYERAEEYARQAVQLDPNHVEARKLLDEIYFILGKGRPGAMREMVDKAVEKRSVEVQQAEAEIRYRIGLGNMHMDNQKYDKAIEEFQTALDMIRAFPYEYNLTVTYREQIEELLKTASAKWEEYRDILEKERQAKVEELKEKEEAERKGRLGERIATLMRQAQNMFEEEEFKKAELICHQVLRLDPGSQDAILLRDASATARRKKHERGLMFIMNEEWKRTREKVDMLVVPQVEDVAFPEADVWDMISKRPPIGYVEAREDLSAAAKDILARIQTTKISIDFVNTPLSNAIEFLRQTSGVPMVVDPAVPEDITINITVDNITIEQALKLILETRGFAFKIDEGYITIGTRDIIEGGMVRQIYSIQDMTIRLPDYAAPEISLVPLEGEGDGGVEIGAEQETGRAIDEEILIQLIKNNIARGTWAEPGAVEPGKGSIEAQRGALIVRHTPEVHKRIQGLLNEIRASTGMIVIMEARFLWVYDNFLQEVGVDLRGLDDNVFLDDLGIYEDLNEVISEIPGEGPQEYTYGYWRTSRGGAADVRARLENIFDAALGNRATRMITSEGGSNFEFTLLSNTQVNAILRAVRKSHRAAELIAPRLAVYNTQRGNVIMANQFRYVSDYDVEVATEAWAADPIPDTVTDGISLDARPTVSADRKYITLELRPTVARLDPPPPEIGYVLMRLVVPWVAGVYPLDRTIELPVIKMQRLRTTVIIPDGGTLLVGGVSQVVEEDLETGVPILSKIPILNLFLSRKGTDTVRKHLLILMRAKILIMEEQEEMKF